jgi:hypothetical protein
VDLEGLIGGGLNLLGGVARRAPLAGEVLPLLADAERAVVRVMRRHLTDLDPPVAVASADTEQTPTPNQLLRTLLDRSMYTSPDKSRDALYLDLLQALVPDEARILAALSDGSAYPVIHVGEPGAGGATYTLKNASTVGRAAGVSLPRHTPLYLTRMLGLGLVRLGPEMSSLYDEYEMLLTDSVVNIALATARRGVRSARVVRRTVRISDLGQELWEAAK